MTTTRSDRARIVGATDLRDHFWMSDQPKRPGSVAANPRVICVAVALGFLLAEAAASQLAMKPTAPEKMMSPDEKKRLEECDKMAAQKNIKMDERAKFLMDCLKAKAE